MQFVLHAWSLTRAVCRGVLATALRSAVALSRAWWLQGVEDLEEVLSERLQQLPAPSSERRSVEAAREAPLVHMPDELPAERARVRGGPCCTQHLCCGSGVAAGHIVWLLKLLFTRKVVAVPCSAGAGGSPLWHAVLQQQAGVLWLAGGAQLEVRCSSRCTASGAHA